MPTKIQVERDAKQKRDEHKAKREFARAQLEARPALSRVDPDLLLDQSTVAGILGTTEKFLERRRCAGGGPKFVRVGRLCRYRAADLEAWIESKTMASTSQASK